MDDFMDHHLWKIKFLNHFPKFEPSIILNQSFHMHNIFKNKFLCHISKFVSSVILNQNFKVCNVVKTKLYALKIRTLRYHKVTWCSKSLMSSSKKVFMYSWNQYINLKKKLHSSTGNICTLFYLYSNKHDILVNVCTLFSEHP